MDLLTRLERLPAGKFHYKLLGVSGIGWMFDSMDTGLIAFVLPALAKDWGLTTGQMGAIGSVGLLGMAVGAVFSGSMADRFGRKNVFAGTLLLYSAATGLCGFAQDFWQLLLFRFLVGFGLGGELPVAATLVTEYVPSAQRGRFIVLLESFWGIGWLLAAIIAYLFIPKYGWQSAFFLGALPALYVFVLRMHLPESVRYLIAKGRSLEAHELICGMEKAAGFEPAADIIEPPVPPPVKSSFRELFEPLFRKRTLMLWAVWFGIVYSYYGIFTWLPSLMVAKGYTIIRTFEAVIIMTLAQIPGYLAAAWLVDRVGRKATLASFMAACAVCAYWFGQGGSANAVIFWGSLMSFFNLGAWGVIYTYTPELYPTRIRAFGSGWAAAVGRVGGIFAPTVVGAMLAAKMDISVVFIMFTAVMLTVAAIVIVAGEETKLRRLDEISE